jgi:ribokinase
VGQGRTRPVAVVGSFAVGLSLRVERWPSSGETVLAGDFDRGPGGKGSNQAVQIARLRHPVELVGAIGDDDFGRIALDLYETEGVGTSCLRRTDRRNTGVGFIVIDPSGDNRVVLDPGANALLGEDDVRRAAPVIEAAAVVLTQLEIPAEAAAAALRAGRAAGATTILNPAPARTVPREILADVDLLTPNQTEARVLLGLAADDPRPDAEVCAELRAGGAGTVVMTRGERGALVATGDGSMTEVPSRAVEVVDSTGAGDAFNGTLAAALAAGAALEAAVARAVVAGALACRRLGVIPSLPRADELEEALGARP